MPHITGIGWIFTEKKEATPITRFLWMGFSIYIDHILKTIARHCEVLFCVGKSIADKYGKFAKKAFTYANFLHTENDVVKEVRSLCVRPPYKLLYVGELEERKGVEYLIKAIVLLRKSGIDTELTIVGAGSLEKKLRDIAESEGLSQYIEFSGYIQHGKKLMDIYRFSDIFVLPSISSEGTPKVLMEAMSQGIPVIATNVGSSKHLLADGKYGILAEPKDVESLKTAIESLINDSDLRSNLVAEGLKLALSSTSDSQKMIVKNGLSENIPEIMGKPTYLSRIGQARY
ncbi:MAG: glycosyltransferase family 4 protein [Desulfobacteraceae bacterium]|nr:glycosyltransferase family 4 protein [Desulfobacteraceae bacterium]